ncbi:TPA: phage antirepressor protein [Acinetobacter baumannii]|uniref:Prophage antirepressor n=1 Tax=Acinetobacter baumannii (strain ACICU) TaxID=405416 RepID=A0A7U3XYV1_ACIBC|nr:MULTISPECIES: Bro-N domain-containing protein [Acinetobacter calcoaceticus/baumannii complex]ALJ99017.1 antirepressor protein [Acinetobacter phage Ab105-3phi]ASK85825.1 BRO family antirepressor [Acinetobacter phage Ab105-2phi]ACC56370.1 Prophage antirepressor [Acinetobacter baumannii ACICU]APJ20237.1 phage antirepressor protein [Acinetobacter baumannii]AWO18097.1 phage antirepressor protein [Acinetobacter baumannii]
MSNISVFNFNQNEIRTVLKDDGEIWFVASDVATVLEYSVASAMIRHLDEDEKGVSIVHTLGGEQEVSIISESGLYSATLKSRKPEAKQFKKWITSDVLPSIRKNGGYIAGQENDDPELILAKALQVANNVILRKTQELQQARIERDFAIETKAHISDKKTATAMATASVKSRQAEKLKEQIGESKNYASVKAVEKVAGGKYNWRELKKWCLAHGKKIKDIADANYGSVKIYHKDAWKAVYGINLTDYFAA